jgi:hypothetical protein
MMPPPKQQRPSARDHGKRRTPAVDRAAQRPTFRTSWRRFLVTRLWPWVVLAAVVSASLHLLLVKILGQQWLARLLIPAVAVGPAAAWWVRGRGREPTLGYFALVWLLLMVVGWTDATVVESQVAGLLLTGSYWGLWGWFCKLRKLPSTPLPLADQLSVCIFLVTGPPGIAAMAGPEAVTQWNWLAAGLLVTLLLTVGVVVLGMKGPTLLQELAKNAPPWVLSWLRVYREPSLLVAVSMGFIAVMLAFQPLAPDWLSPWLGLIYLGTVGLLTGLLLRRSHGKPRSSDHTSPEATASRPPPGAPPRTDTP